MLENETKDRLIENTLHSTHACPHSPALDILDELLDDSGCKGDAVVRGGASAELVQQHERPRGRHLEDCRYLSQLHLNESKGKESKGKEGKGKERGNGAHGKGSARIHAGVSASYQARSHGWRTI